MKKLTLFFVFAMITTSNLFASLSTSVAVSKRTANLGDKITVEIKVITTETQEVSFQLDLLDDKSFNSSKPEKTIEKLPGNYTMAKLTFNIFPFKFEEIKPGTVTIIQGSEKVVKDIPTITVESIFKQGDEKKEINPLKGQIEIKPDYSHIYKLIVYIVIGLILLFGLYLLVKKLLKKYKNKEIEEEEIILDPPCDEVKQMLSQLLSSQLLKEGKVKEFFVQLSEIGKRFLGRSFDFDYQFLTTEETNDLVKGHINMAEERVVRDFFNMCDLVKFAKVIPSQGEINGNVNLCYKFVEMICTRINEKEENNVQI